MSVWRSLRFLHSLSGVRIWERSSDTSVLMRQGFENADKRFEAMDKRFEELRSDMNQRFEMLITFIDKRFEAVDKRFAFMQWLIVAGFGTLSLMLTFYSLKEANPLYCLLEVSAQHSASLFLSLKRLAVTI